MGTIGAIGDVMDWLETTFGFVRARSSPNPDAVEELRERVRDTLAELRERGFVATDDLRVSATPLGTLASVSALRLPTASRFGERAGTDPGTDEILETVAAQTEPVEEPDGIASDKIAMGRHG